MRNPNKNVENITYSLDIHASGILFKESIFKAVNPVSDLILCADLFHNLSRFDIVKD